jgi:ABC-type glutathione transport system ATPase component
MYTNYTHHSSLYFLSIIFILVANGLSEEKNETTEEQHRDTEEKDHVAAPALINIDFVLEKVGSTLYKGGNSTQVIEVNCLFGIVLLVCRNSHTMFQLVKLNSNNVSFDKIHVTWFLWTMRDHYTFVMFIDHLFLKGKLIGVCGSVGSGKSSLISAILGRVSHGSFFARSFLI